MSMNNVLASVAVKNLGASIAWYERLFGRPADSRPMPEVAEWKFERGGWLQVYQLPERAGRGSFTIAVAHLAEEIAKLRKLGVDPGKTMGDDRVKTVMIKDPDGNSIALSQTTDATMAR